MSRLNPVLVALVVLAAPSVGALQLPPPSSAQVRGSRAAQAAREAEQPAKAPQGQALAEPIGAARPTASGRAFDAGYRKELVGQLATLPLARLESMLAAEPAADLGDPVPGNIGDTNADLVFTPLTPCRIIDTRLSGGIMPASTTRDFFVAGATGFTGQGGNASGCNVPDGPATAVMINFVAVTATGSGHLQATAWVGPSTPMPNASILNYGNLAPNQNAIANGIALPICNPAAITCDFDLRVQANGNSTHVVADVMGYFRSHQQAAVPPGTIVAYAGTTPPSGWLSCNGTSVNRSDYPELFAAIGAAYGSSSAATFNVPDFRGRFLRGVDQGAGRDPDSAARSAMNAGGNVGDNVGSVQDWATGNPGFTTGTGGSHVHALDDYYFSENQAGGGTWLGSAWSDWDNRGHSTRHNTLSAGAHSHTVDGGDTETRAINAYVQWIIKF